MLRLCVAFSLLASTLSYNSETWPFKLADRYMEEFKSSVNELKKLQFETQEQNSSQKKVIPVQEEPIEDPILYDFIIVGGGTSGSVLASRLSEIPEWKILLLEAGHDENKASRVPKNWELLRNTPYNWKFETTPQNYSCLAMTNHQCTIPSGKLLGGTSSINSMVYTRGNSRDFDIWADLGNKGWCWEEVLPIYKKIENINFEPFDKKYHNQGGKQYLQHPQYLTHLSENIIEAAKELEIHHVDYNGKYQSGVSLPQLTTDCGQRSSAANAYLDRAQQRRNLIIRPLAKVSRVVISEHTKDAKGVEYFHDGKVFLAKAKKEVILAAGAINTAKILLLSGIGPKEECKKHQIPLLSDLKVGHNLKIRPSFIGLDFFYKESRHQESDEYNEILQYLKFSKGPLTTPGIAAILFLKTEASKGPENYPDIELQIQSKDGIKFEDFQWTSLSKKHYESIWKPLEHKQFAKFIVTLNHPKSIGIVTLKNSNPLDDPIIEPNLLSDEDEVDYNSLLAGIKKAIKLSHTEAFKKSGFTINPHQIYGCEETEFGTDAYWECAIKYLVVPTEDVSGTARMGSHDDQDAVVDEKLNVHGVHKLRIADASIIPVSITGNLIATNMMIAEQAAHFIIHQWQD